jgi:hypothetical protein
MMTFRILLLFPIFLVEDVIEVEKVQCNPNIDSFQTVVDVSFDSDSDDGVITPELANTLTQTFIRSYNTLAERFCDPYFREVQDELKS